MGEYMGTTVEFGGKIKACDLEKLANELLDGSEEELYAAAQAKESYITQGESNYGMATELCAVLADLGLSYRRTCDAKYEYDGDGEYYNAETGDSIEFSCNQDGEPTLNLAGLRERLKDGKTLQDVVDELSAPNAKLPPLEIIDDTPLGG